MARRTPTAPHRAAPSRTSTAIPKPVIPNDVPPPPGPSRDPKPLVWITDKQGHLGSNGELYIELRQDYGTRVSRSLGAQREALTYDVDLLARDMKSGFGVVYQYGTSLPIREAKALAARVFTDPRKVPVARAFVHRLHFHEHDPEIDRKFGMFGRITVPVRSSSKTRIESRRVFSYDRAVRKQQQAQAQRKARPPKVPYVSPPPISVELHDPAVGSWGLLWEWNGAATLYRFDGATGAWAVSARGVWSPLGFRWSEAPVGIDAVAERLHPKLRAKVLETEASEVDRHTKPNDGSGEDPGRMVQVDLPHEGSWALHVLPGGYGRIFRWDGQEWQGFSDFLRVGDAGFTWGVPAGLPDAAKVALEARLTGRDAPRRPLHPGDRVSSTYRTSRTGEVLAVDDPHAWAGSIAFAGPSLDDVGRMPSVSEVRMHLAHLEAQGVDHDDVRLFTTGRRVPGLRPFAPHSSTPVRWDFGKVLWNDTDNLFVVTD